MSERFRFGVVEGDLAPFAPEIQFRVACHAVEQCRHLLDGAGIARGGLCQLVEDFLEDVLGVVAVGHLRADVCPQARSVVLDNLVKHRHPSRCGSG